jgi:putative copper export protein
MNSFQGYAIMDNSVMHQYYMDKAYCFYKLATIGSILLLVLFGLMALCTRKKRKSAKKIILIEFIITVLYFVIMSRIGYGYQEITYRM